MQRFEFQADASVSLASTAAINRKSCDHCFLNRKTCDKVRGPNATSDSGEKCKRCGKDGRPCTFTPTVHLYHIADCVGRHQCRAKVIQAMGGRKKEFKFKTIEIPIVCDMESEADQALYDYIQKQPNLLVYNNRMKSFLAHDILGLPMDDGDHESSPADQDVPDDSTKSESPSHGSKRSFETEDTPGNKSTSPTQGPAKFRIMALIDAHQNNPVQQHPTPQQLQQQQQLQATRQKRQSNDFGRGGHSPQVQPVDVNRRLSTLQSPSTLSPADAMTSHQRRLSETLAGSTLSSMGSMNNPYASMYQTQSMNPNTYLYQQHQQQQTSQYSQGLSIQTNIAGYRSTSSAPPSPLVPSPTHHSPHPPSPLELSLNINTDFGAMVNGSHQNLPSLFDTSLTMSQQQQQQQHQHQHHQHQQQQHQGSEPERVSVGTSTSPMMGTMTDSDMSGLDLNNSVAPPQPPPLVITTTNEDGNEVGFYYAVPSVNLNPAYSDADLFQDFTMMDALGEDFVWIENLFDDPTPEEAAANMAAMSVAAAAGQSVDGMSTVGSDSSTPLAVPSSSALTINAMLNPTEDVAMKLSSSSTTVTTTATSGDGAGVTGMPWMDGC
ncbi:hypothetical protein BGZ93_001466 [Podila epicladia]|nr:hypothetical protein BGZ92_006764 [Podila epicladia]KAG0097995.1 hypothetical protein BGZ93_001466 [Podila epicladia]